MIKLKNLFYSIVMLIIVANAGFANSYIMLANYPITAVEGDKSNVVCVKPMTSLMNEKKSIIVTPLKDGVGEFKVKLKNRTLTYKAIVKDGQIEFQGNRVIKIVPLDLPPEVMPENGVCK